MLQQTTVRAVIPYYDRFLRRFPTAEALARAGERDLLGAWAGLGYYSRARNLQAATRRVVQNGGRFPDDYDGLLALPGIGDYTAGALASIAFGRPEPALDGNACRVLARLLGVREDPKRGPVRARLRAWAADLLAGVARHGGAEAPGQMNQAVMELGATVCTPRSPRCTACPLAGECRARAMDLVDEIPARPTRPPPRVVHSGAILLTRAGRVLLARRAEGEFMNGFWELPGTLPVDLARSGRAHGTRTAGASGAGPRGPTGRSASGLAKRLARTLEARHGLRVIVGRRIARVTHTITFRKIELSVFDGTLLEPTRRSSTGSRTLAWVRGPLTGGEEPAPRPLGTLTRKALSLCRETGPANGRSGNSPLQHRRKRRTTPSRSPSWNHAR